jgi:dUTP pyrophosphatase
VSSFANREVHIKATEPWAGIPARSTGKSFGYDLQTIKQETVPPRGTLIVQTGLRLAKDLPYWPNHAYEPQGLAMLILPRSSLAIKHGLIVANSPGLIDADYTGDIGIVLHNLKDEPVVLEMGWRIAQAVFVQLFIPQIVEADKVEEREERGGFGSTGQ